VPRLAAIKLSSKIAAETFDPAHAPKWAEAIGDNGTKLEAVLAEKEAVGCDSAATFA